MQVYGNKILGFPWGDSEIEQIFCDFYIREDSHEFTIEVDNYPIETACDLVFSNESIHKEYLFCYDESGKAFTIYDCFIMPMQIPVKQMKIVWNQCLWGYHIENFQDAKITFAEYIVQTDKTIYPFHMFVGKNDFKAMDGRVNISTNWNRKGSKIEGVGISISLKEGFSISEVEKIVLRMLELFFLQIGFFPKVEKRTMITEENKKFYFMEEFVAYGKTAKSNIKLDYVLYIKKILIFH